MKLFFFTFTFFVSNMFFGCGSNQDGGSDVKASDSSNIELADNTGCGESSAEAKKNRGSGGSGELEQAIREADENAPAPVPGAGRRPPQRDSSGGSTATPDTRAGRQPKTVNPCDLDDSSADSKI